MFSKMDLSFYQSRLLLQLDEQRRRDLFCDCHILVEGKMFMAHRNVLFASSGYFKMFLSQSCRDVGQPSTVTFDVFSADTFTAIIDYMYSGRLPLSGQNVIEVMSAASYLQMTDVISVCKEFIKSSLDINEKERDNLFSLSGGEPAHQPRDYVQNNVAWGGNNCASIRSDSDISGCRGGAGAWNPYGPYPVTSNLSSNPCDRPTSQRASERHHEAPQLPITTCCPEERVQGHKISETDSTTKVNNIPDDEYIQDEAGMDCWTVTRRKEMVKSSDKNKATKAEQLYATMPTIMGIAETCGKDASSSMRFKCPFCTHMVKRKADLKRHLRCHTGERPYPCQACGKRFTRLEHVRSHYRTIHEAGKPVCRRCKKHVTEETGQVVQDGTRRFRLCTDCLAEFGVDSFPIEVDDDDDDDDDDPTIVLSGDEDKELPWSQHDRVQQPKAKLEKDTLYNLIIHEVDDSDEDIKPVLY
uniref:Zinc finger and BTB domain-containing protein 8A n=1 Tax=Leptobrachium leishanense TaxID=445787 RepID=A0A8C5LU42_9ANUR